MPTAPVAIPALTKTYLDMRPSLLAIFRQAGLPMADCEDMVQDTFLKVMGIDVLREDTLGAIVVAVAYSLRADYLRHRAVVRHYAEHFRRADSANTYDYADQQLLANEIRSIERDALQRLTADNRRIYALSRFHDRNYEEIATAMNMSYRAVESRLYRARQEVRHAVAQAI